MVKYLRILLLFLILISFSCDFMQSSPFDNEESLLLLSVNLSEYIFPVVDETKLSLLDNGSTELLFLYIERNFSANQKRVIIMNKSLHVLDYYDDDGAIINLGELSMVDANGNFIIGNTVFNENGIPVFNLSVSGIDPYCSGFSDIDSGENFIFEINNGVYPPHILCRIFNNQWSLYASYVVDIGPSSEYSFVQTVHDYNRSVLFFILSENNNSTYHSVIYNNELFPDFIMMPTLLEYESAVEFGDLDSGTIGFAGDGIAGANHDKLKLLSPVNGEAIDEFEWENSNGVFAYDLSGDHFYVYDSDSKNLNKYFTWWDKEE